MPQAKESPGIAIPFISSGFLEHIRSPWSVVGQEEKMSKRKRPIFRWESQEEGVARVEPTHVPVPEQDPKKKRAVPARRGGFLERGRNPKRSKSSLFSFLPNPERVKRSTGIDGSGQKTKTLRRRKKVGN